MLKNSLKQIIKLIFGILMLVFATMQIQQDHLDTWFISYFLLYLLILFNLGNNNNSHKQSNR